MKNILSVEKISKSFGVKELFSEVSFGVAAQDKLGIVGLNGVGKSTLLRIITGSETSEQGRVAIKKDIKVGVLPQQDDFLGQAEVLTYLASNYPDNMHNWESSPSARNIIAGLKLSDLLTREIHTLSGGQKRRVAIAGVLLSFPQLLILDEPTNHLDITTINWLGNYLHELKAALICVTHDRWFLDKVCNKMLEIAEKTVIPFHGGFSSWLAARKERHRVSLVTAATKKNLAKKEQEWLNTGAKARTSKAKFRINAAEELIAATQTKMDPNPELLSLQSSRQGKIVVDLTKVTYSYSPSTPPVFVDLTWQLLPQQRIGVVGNNGTGKSTLIKLLTGDLTPDRGDRKVGVTTKIAVLTQEIEDLPPSKTILEAISEIATHIKFADKEISASQLAKKVGFSEAEQLTKVVKLSGGQRRRLQLVRLLMTAPNLLILDEPTNDLDIDLIEQLEAILVEWTGTLLVISHDRYFLANTTENIFALYGDGTITHLPRGIEQFFEHSEETISPAKVNPISQVKYPNKYELEKNLKSIERKITKSEELVQKLTQQLAEVATDRLKFTELNEQYQLEQINLQKLQEQWLATVEQLDS